MRPDVSRWVVRVLPRRVLSSGSVLRLDNEIMCFPVSLLRGALCTIVLLPWPVLPTVSRRPICMHYAVRRRIGTMWPELLSASNALLS
jgi:hypothetical protein